MGDRSKSAFAFHDVVLIADLAVDIVHGPARLRHDLEATDLGTLASLIAAIESLGLRVHHYTDPKALALHACQHAGDIVLSIYGGADSRNRMALVPAICEAYGLSYVGPDVYGRVICQDKELSKNLARQCGLRTPEHRIIRSPSDIEVAQMFPVPFVAKPLLEGSSIGISQQNLVRDANEGSALVLDILAEFHQPVIIEQFVPGKEVSYNCIEARPMNHSAYSEIRVEGAEDYFDSHLFDADEKLNRRLRRSVRAIDALLSPLDRSLIDKFLQTLGRFGYCRVDGKHDKGSFVFLEVTPDAWIGPKGAFAGSFIDKGWAYQDVIASLLTSATLSPPGR